MAKLANVIDAVSEWSGKLFAFTIYIGLIVLVWEVGARYLFNAPTVWAHGTSQRVFAAYYFIAGAYVLLHNGHINMDLLYARFSPRGRAILDLISAPFLFAFCGVLLWYGSIYAWQSLKVLEVCGTPFHAPLYPVKLMIPLGSFLLILQALNKFAKAITIAVKGIHDEYSPVEDLTEEKL